MPSVFSTRALAVAALILFAGCRSILPGPPTPMERETNLSFTLERNLIELPSMRIGGREGTFLFGTASQETVLDPRFAATVVPGGTTLDFGGRRSVDITPRIQPLGGVADAIIGADAARNRTVSVDYRSGLVTWHEAGVGRDFEHIWRFQGEPAVVIEVDGRTMRAVVDTSIPDTLVLPAAGESRDRARVRLAGIDYGVIDVRRDDVSQARIGNRVLVQFLVSIDYRRGLVGLWRDPRIPVNAGTQATVPTR